MRETVENSRFELKLRHGTSCNWRKKDLVGTITHIGCQFTLTSCENAGIRPFPVSQEVENAPAKATPFSYRVSAPRKGVDSSRSLSVRTPEVAPSLGVRT